MQPELKVRLDAFSGLFTSTFLHKLQKTKNQLLRLIDRSIHLIKKPLRLFIYTLRTLHLAHLCSVIMIMIILNSRSHQNFCNLESLPPHHVV